MWSGLKGIIRFKCVLDVVRHTGKRTVCLFRCKKLRTSKYLLARQWLVTQPAYIRHRGSGKPYLDIVSKYC